MWEKIPRILSVFFVHKEPGAAVAAAKRLFFTENERLKIILLATVYAMGYLCPMCDVLELE
jgi:hypothetical protein